MKAGLMGRPGSGRGAVFSALTGLPPPPAGAKEPRLGEALFPDERLDFLSARYGSRRHTPARVEFFLPPPPASPRETSRAGHENLREAEVILAVLRNFAQAGQAPPDPVQAAAELEEELILSDYLVAQKRMERLAEDRKRGKKNDPEEADFLARGLAELEAARPLRSDPDFARHPKLKGFAFLSAKPLLALLNNAETDEKAPDLGLPWPLVVVRGRLERDLAALPPGEAAEFLAGYGLLESASARVIREIYRLMDLRSFFTVNDEECRAWAVAAGETAWAAAGAVHSDIQKGFIRAEVVAFDDFRAAGGLSEARKKGLVRLEGKNYVIADGDIIHFRFAV